MAFSFNPLWKLLIDKNMTKDQFRKDIAISSSTLAKMRKGENISMEILDKVCKKFNCTLNDIVEFVNEAPTEENNK